MSNFRLLTIVDGSIVLTDDSSDPHSNVPTDSVADLDALSDTLDIYVSSSLDFPGDYTSDPKVLALAAAIRDLHSA